MEPDYRDNHNFRGGRWEHAAADVGQIARS